MDSAIKKIIIEVGGVELSLTPEDAKKLHAALSDLFPSVKAEREYVPYPIYPIQPVMPSPWWKTTTGGTFGVSDVSISLLNTGNPNGTACTDGGDHPDYGFSVASVFGLDESSSKPV